MENFDKLFDNLKKALSLIPMDKIEVTEKMKLAKDMTSKNPLYQYNMPQKKVAFTFEFASHNVESPIEKETYKRKGRMFVDMNSKWEMEGIEIEYPLIEGRDDFVMTLKYDVYGSLMYNSFKRSRFGLKDISERVSQEIKKVEKYFKIDKKVIKKMIANGFNYRSNDTDSCVEYDYDSSGFVHPVLNILTSDFNYKDDIFNKKDSILSVKFDHEFNIKMIRMTNYKKTGSKISMTYDTKNSEPFECVISSRNKKFEDVIINPNGMTDKDILEYEMIVLARSMNKDLDEMFPEMTMDMVIDYGSVDYRNKIEIVKMLII